MTQPVALLVHKRDGLSHAPEQIQELVQAFLAGKLTDYQMSAWLMAAWIRGLDETETSALTDAMLRSGTILTHRGCRGPLVDKHSTGGVGDKISLCLAPLVAACGASVPMIAGRGLGHTGGTLDKLEAISGYQTRLSTRRFQQLVRQLGVSIIGQTAELAPADRRIYSLRDVTGTVESIPLITASILSKKLAAGVQGLVLDVKVGSGAFMRTQAQARRLADSLISVGQRSGMKMVALLTDMNVPLGRTIGNALETREAIQVLRNEGPPDVRELTLALGAEMLVLGRLAPSLGRARRMLERALADGSAYAKWVKMVAAHGGDTAMVEHPERLPHTRQRVPVTASKTGWIHGIEPRVLAWVALEMGAGRIRAEDPIDPAVGIELSAMVGERVEKGQPLAYLHINHPSKAKPLVPRVQAAFSLGARRPQPRTLILERREAKQPRARVR